MIKCISPIIVSMAASLFLLTCGIPFTQKVDRRPINIREFKACYDCCTMYMEKEHGKVDEHKSICASLCVVVIRSVKDSNNY